jgi:hypothetical protein
MPGTDMCIKIGGWVRAEVTDGTNGSSTTGVFGTNYNNRTTNNLWTRERGYITADAREQTAYGVARGYIDVGVSSNNTGDTASSFSSNRAFVQWAGFTAGLSVSFFDFYPAAALLYRAGNIPNEDTGDGGIWIWGYTAQFGGGFSASLSAEGRRASQILAFSGAGGALGGPATPASNGVLTGNGGATYAGFGGWQTPDFTGNLRVDQAWGSAQVMGALHQDNATYYGATPSTGGPSDDNWGWVVGAGLKINTPFISPGDYFITEANYTQGALKYLWDANPSDEQGVRGATEGFGIFSDCIYGGTGATATGCQKTTGFGFDIAYEHYWTPQWHQSLVFNGMWAKYGSSANAMLCTGELAPGAGSTSGSGAVAAAGCNNNWDDWGVGSRLQWDVTKSFYIGVEAIYQNLDSASLPGGKLTGPITLLNSGATTVSNETNWEFTVRMHKDFLP